MSHRGLRGYLFLPALAFKGVNFRAPTQAELGEQARGGGSPPCTPSARKAIPWPR
jgi:hypothetical protein